MKTTKLALALVLGAAIASLSGQALASEFAEVCTRQILDKSRSEPAYYGPGDRGADWQRFAPAWCKCMAHELSEADQQTYVSINRMAQLQDQGYGTLDFEKALGSPREIKKMVKRFAKIAKAATKQCEEEVTPP